MLIQFFLIALLAIVAIPVLVLFTQVLAAILLVRKTVNIADGKNPTISILMPAHNESLIIASTIANLSSELSSDIRLLVVADNCSDDTAVIARSLQVDVIERTHDTKRGKGYALDFGIQHLKKSPPDIVIVLDADCAVSKNTLLSLAKACTHYRRPVQALYLMHAQASPNIRQRIAAFAWVVKNKVRPLGWANVGLPCQLMGTGMAFLWEDIAQADLANGHIVEDMKLGVDFAKQNKPPIFFAEVVVSSVFPVDQEAINSQRARWEHGHISVILAELPSMLLHAVRHKNWQMLGLSLDLLVPPVASLSIICGLLLVATVLLHQFIIMPLVILFASVIFFMLFLSLLWAWYFYGRHIISFKQLCYAPIYAFVKIPLYVKFFINRQVEWVRSKRD